MPSAVTEDPPSPDRMTFDLGFYRAPKGTLTQRIEGTRMTVYRRCGRFHFVIDDGTGKPRFSPRAGYEDEDEAAEELFKVWSGKSGSPAIETSRKAQRHRPGNPQLKAAMSPPTCEPDPGKAFAALFTRTSAGNLCHLADGVMLTVFPRDGWWWWAIDEGLGVATYFSSDGYETEEAALAALEDSW